MGSAETRTHSQFSIVQLSVIVDGMFTSVGEAVEPLPESMRRVCVWFGQHLIIDHLDNAISAAGFELAMRQRFASLRVTNEPASEAEVRDVVGS